MGEIARVALRECDDVIGGVVGRLLGGQTPEGKAAHVCVQLQIERIMEGHELAMRLAELLSAQSRSIRPLTVDSLKTHV